ncbi:MAG: LPS export ABC transporter periplasmic protein LptC [Desulfobulbaceae bacterium]|nr:LPS export ABC transporter periplasmic protein LptC [Desulfobulbaceae bacterium]MCK5436505.1 LPS export ABC transporter periplasmic protein LptC [Desulfobulbaceae bacterium]MCK5543673.1 LPS export ABC transporter periplasmic protein LptC [Desulfobulbaceae bacterium]
MTWRRHILWFLPFLFLVTAPLWQGTIANFLKPRGEFDLKADSGPASLRLFTMEEAHLSQITKGIKEWDIKAAKVYSEGVDSAIRMDGVEAVFYDRGRADANILSGKATYDEKKQILTLMDDVHLVTRDGHELRTEALRYLVKFQKIKTAVRVRLFGENVEIQGNSLFYDLKTGAFRVGGRVSCDFI